MPQWMKLVSLAATVCMSLLASGPASGDETATGSTLVCDVGPIQKTYGGTDWLVYSCNDERSVVIASSAGSPANPFVFRFLAREDGYLLQSAGTGDKKFTTAAFNELKVMSENDIETLVTLTKAGAQ